MYKIALFVLFNIYSDIAQKRNNVVSYFFLKISIGIFFKTGNVPDIWHTISSQDKRCEYSYFSLWTVQELVGEIALFLI